MISTLTKIRNNYPNMYKEFEEFVSNEFQTNFINPGTELGLLLHFIQSTILIPVRKYLFKSLQVENNYSKFVKLILRNKKKMEGL